MRDLENVTKRVWRGCWLYRHPGANRYELNCRDYGMVEELNVIKAMCDQRHKGPARLITITRRLAPSDLTYTK